MNADQSFQSPMIEGYGWAGSVPLMIGYGASLGYRRLRPPEAWTEIGGEKKLC